MNSMSQTDQSNQPDLTERELSPERISEYFLELEGSLDRIERAITYYQVLDLERTASAEETRLAYQQVITMLSPSYSIRMTMPEQMVGRVHRAFTKASQAYSVLSNFGRRIQYDNSLVVKTTQPLPVEVPDPSRSGMPFANASTTNSAAPGQEIISINSATMHKVVYSTFSHTAKGDNRRRCERFKLSLPVRVVGHDRRAGKWHEMAETIDVSRTGVNIRLRRRVRYGNVLYVTLPLPVKLRAHGYADSSYNVYALVRRVDAPKRGVRTIGLEFLGEHPPSGYLDKPWATFRTKTWAGHERRRKPRINKLEVVEIEYFNEAMQSIAREAARTENISRSGLRMMVKAAPPDFELIKVTCAKHAFESLAVLRSRFVGKDGVERACVQFIDCEWPA